jgi:hypothetical protein
MKLVETSNWIQIDIDIDANFLINPSWYVNNEFKPYHAFLTSYNIISHLIWKQSHIGTKPFLVLWLFLEFVYHSCFHLGLCFITEYHKFIVLQAQARFDVAKIDY